MILARILVVQYTNVDGSTVHTTVQIVGEIASNMCKHAQHT